MNQGVAIKNSPVFLMPKGSSFPGSPSEGQYFYRTDEDKVYIYDGTEWDELGGGVTSHGELTGLDDDDHSQYLNTTRHDTTTRHPVSVIKTAVGSNIGSGSGDVYFTLHRKTFFPQMACSGGKNLKAYYITSDPGDYIGRFVITDMAGCSYWIRWDYLSASGPPVIWVITDDKGKIVNCWEAEDPPDSDNPDLAPIQIDPMPADWHSVKVVIPANYKTIRKVACQAKKALSSYLIDNYTVNLKTKKLKSL